MPKAFLNRKEEAYNDLMYRAYFIEELDIGNALHRMRAGRVLKKRPDHH